MASFCNVEEPFVEGVLERIQEFDPPGTGARDLRECLLIQAQQLSMAGTLVEIIIRNHLQDLENRKYKQIAKAMGCEVNDVLLSAKIIATLDPQPGRVYCQDEVHYISADIFVYKIGEEYVVVLNDEGLPNLRINPLYVGEWKNGPQVDSKAEEYVSDKMRSAIDSVGQALQGMLDSLSEMAQDTAEGGKIVRGANNAASFTSEAASELVAAAREMSQVVRRVTQLALRTKQIAAQIDDEAADTGRTGSAFTSVVAGESIRTEAQP